MSDKYSVYSEFDLTKHKQTFHNYFEVVMLPNGKIEYAVPSHQEYLIAYLENKWHCTRTEVGSRCPRDMWFDFLTWLTRESGCLALYSHGYQGSPNRIQKSVLHRLVMEGLTEDYCISQ